MSIATGKRTSRRRGSGGETAGGGTKKLSRLRRPEGMSLEEWQIELRRQFGGAQDFRLKNRGDEPVFSEFEVTNPASKSTYRVAIRGARPGDNYCSCPDFATNTLGTCKHVEFTLASLRRKRGGERALAEGFQPPYSEVYLSYGSQREVRFRPGTECPRELVRLASRFFDDERKLEPDAVQKFDQFLDRANRLEHDLRVYDDVMALVAEIRDAQRRRQRLAEAFPKGTRSAAFKRLLRFPLYEYQREGVLFAARAGRSLIADEMGLGKTMQAIGAAEVMARLFGVERVLVVCPTSLKHQWQREIGRAVDRTVEVVGGLRASRARCFASDTFYKVINYDTLHRDLDLVRGWGPELVILDEAQRIKNWKTRAAKAVKQIVSPYAIVLTGTPLENRLEELLSIVEFVDRHRLGPTFRFLDRHQKREGDTGRVVGYEKLDEIGETLAPILIRRRKEEVLDQLPGRLDKHFFVPMTPEQMTYHDENREIVARIVQKWIRFGFLTEADQQRLMIALQNMRMSCNSTYLLDKQTDFGVKADELADLLAEVFEEPQVKVVVFSQWLRMHELLERRWRDRGWKYVLFHGGIDGSKRKGLVDRFREETVCRSFLSTDAGGVGLNLQHASVVVNMDLPWNPAVLEQRIGRVHRLGQTRPVRVVNFVAEGTIEHKMLSVLEFKKSLFSGVLDGGEKQVMLGGGRLKRFMETVQRMTSDMPPAAIEPLPQPSGAEPALPPAELLEDFEPGEQAPAAAPGTALVEPPGRLEGVAAAHPLAGLLEAGLALLGQLSAGAPAGSRPGGSSNVSTRVPVGIERDESGRAFVKLPVPDPEVVDQLLGSLRSFLLQAGR